MDKQADENMGRVLCISVKKGEERMSILPLPMELAVIFTSQAGIENNKKTWHKVSQTTVLHVQGLDGCTARKCYFIQLILIQLSHFQHFLLC